MNAQRHFTLIELLVVIGIIGVIAAMLVPALQKAKKAGTRVACASNLKQVGIAVHAYAQSNNEWFPWNCTSQTRAMPERTPIADALDMNHALFKCPNEDEGLFESEGTSYIWNWMQIELPGNGRLGQDSYDIAPYGVVGPGKFPVMLDAGTYHGPAGSGIAVNILFDDGHIGDAGATP